MKAQLEVPSFKAGVALLDEWTEGRWRNSHLQLARLIPRRSGVADPLQAAKAGPRHQPIERAWILTETFGSAVDKSTGRHCTPKSVALALADSLLGVVAPKAHVSPPTSIIDPACGHGALLLALVDRALARGLALHPSLFVGYDIDPLSVAITEAVLWVAAGQPNEACGVFAERDTVAEPWCDRGSWVIANPPWGVKPNTDALTRWRNRVAEVAALLRGEVNIYTLFLLEAVLHAEAACTFLTPIHWLHRRSLGHMRKELAAINRLVEVVVLRKRVFSAASDMIPIISTWCAADDVAVNRAAQREPGDPIGRISVARTGFRAPLPLPYPLPKADTFSLSGADWGALPYAIFPVLRSPELAVLGQSLIGSRSCLSDPRSPRAHRWFHAGDGAYKTRVMGHLTQLAAGELPILTTAAQVRRYHLAPPVQALDSDGAAALTEGEARRFSKPLIAMHALKKASAKWRLSAVVHADGPLAFTNNFLLLVSERYDGDLYYPLALLNSALYNRLYTEHFPGVNIEAYTVGLLPFLWPVVPTTPKAPPPMTAAPSLFYRWSAESRRAAQGLAQVTYDWLREAGRWMQAAPGDESGTRDAQIEAVVAGLLGATETQVRALMPLD